MEPNIPQNQETNDLDFELKQPKVQPFRSMRSDTIDVVHGQKKSLAQMVVAAQKKKRENQKRAHTKAKQRLSTKRLLVSALILVALAGLIALIGMQGADYLKERQTRIKIDVPYLVFPNSQIEFAAGGMERAEFVPAINAILDARNVPKNTLAHIYFTDRTPGTREGWFTDKSVVLPPKQVLALSADNTPSYITNSLGNDYMFGMYGISSNRVAPYLLLTITNYEAAFAGMLAWEKHLENDFTILFKLRHSGVESAFTDKLVANKDVRHLETRSGDTAILYSFLDKETLLITTNADALETILERHVNRSLYEAN